MDARNTLGKGALFLILGTLSIFFAPEELKNSAMQGLTKVHEPTTQGDPTLDILKEPIHNPGSFHAKTDAELHEPHKFQHKGDESDRVGRDSSSGEKNDRSSSKGKQGENAGSDSNGKTGSSSQDQSGRDRDGKKKEDQQSSSSQGRDSKEGSKGTDGKSSSQQGKDSESSRSKDSSRDSTDSSRTGEGSSSQSGRDGGNSQSGSQSSEGGKSADGKKKDGINHEPIHAEDLEDVNLQDHFGNDYGHVTNPFTGERLPSWVEDYFKRTRKWSAILWLDNTIFWSRVALETLLLGSVFYLLAKPKFTRLQHERKVLAEEGGVNETITVPVHTDVHPEGNGTGKKNKNKNKH